MGLPPADGEAEKICDFSFFSPGYPISTDIGNGRSLKNRRVCICMLTTGKIAAALGVHPDTVRNYERRGIIPRARRSPINGYRFWQLEDLDQMKVVLGVPECSQVVDVPESLT